MATLMPSKDPNAIEPYFIVWCDEDGTNTGAAADRGELQGAGINPALVVWTLPAGIGTDSDNTDAVTINGVVYAANTVTTIWLKLGTGNKNYACHCQIVTDDATPRTLEKTIIIPVRAH